MPASALKLQSALLLKASLRQMFVLTKLAELGSMTRAAEAAHMTQPAVSIIVSDLERLIGVPLFLRHARGVKPTQAALELLPVAKRIVAATADGAEAVSAIINGRHGLIRIAASVTANGKLLQPFLPQFAVRFPQIQVELTDLGPRNPLDLIAQQDCHLVCIGEPTTIPENCTFERLCKDRLVVVGRKDHALLGQPTVSYSELAVHRWLTPPAGTVARERFEEQTERMALPFENRSSITTSIPSVILELISKNDFLALLPESVAFPWVAAGYVVAIESEANAPLPSLGMLWQTEGTLNTARTFMSSLAEFSRALPDAY